MFRLVNPIPKRTSLCSLLVHNQRYFSNFVPISNILFQTFGIVEKWLRSHLAYETRVRIPRAFSAIIMRFDKPSQRKLELSSSIVYFCCLFETHNDLTSYIN
jgi:hypothetical protein